MADKDSQDKPDFASGIPSDDLPEGAMLEGTLGEDKVLLLRRDGQVRAIGARCTHLGAPLAKGIVADGEVRCPWHHARFSLETGEAVGAPAFDPLPCYRAEERDGRITVTGRRKAAVRPATRNPGKVVIIGGGAGGHACAEWLARAGHGTAVTLVSDDPDPPYDRTFCSKQYLSGKAKRETTRLAPEGFYGGDGPRLLRDRVVSLDLDAQEIATAGGERLPYDALVIATGAAPQRPDVPGFERPNVHTLRSLADADALIAATETARSVAVVGASFIGLEVAAAMVAREKVVTVVAPDAVPLARVLGEAVGRFVQGLHEDKGVTFRLGREATGFDGTALTLDDGSRIEADLVVLGTGVSPRTDLAEAAGLTLAQKDEGGGIAVDATLAASASGIYAIGDVASYPDPRSDRRLRVEHWVHAQRQGQHVARALLAGATLGEAAPFAETPFFWSGHYGTSLRYVGHAGSAEETQVEGDVSKGDFAVTYREDGRDAALATCKRDTRSLEVEDAWDREGRAAG
ncbi:apoptosis inducing factor family protein [Methylobacterium frigidaeris]|uniref:3-phenylpropionate/cinnamic acid dioxygenase ferredoxin--NAD(+) reductase component n=1 Tax=Methylobacterium frigidaeris TaxID=2038277 RepID=A0AA37M3F1_9HYPH|nr:apoptosis inducing factor family protein [Methylobacterium frigidaeris]PIK69513.1 (2Fe-2S)-binding protein [Methylobacterium frigidaeris]GJD61282.1 3-phenylpropionate/cinnamic acid dioxygenase ferredoxin--NAD(+) reductase component [Methylobacterium frigidaeris]